MSTVICGSRSTKRRTKVDMEAIREAIYRVVQLHQPMTVRQVFYQLVRRSVRDKTEAEYKGTVGRLLEVTNGYEAIP